MIYVFYGNDTFRIKEELKKILESFENISEIFRFENENFNQEEFENLLRTDTLFGQKNIIICAGLIDSKTYSKFILEKIDGCIKSENIFFFTEEELSEKNIEFLKEKTKNIKEFKNLSPANLKKWLDEYIKGKKIKISINAQNEIIKKCSSDLWCVSKEVERFSLGGNIDVSGNGGEYKPFAICDAISQKNKAQAWALFHGALFVGVPAEEVFYKVSWQIKNLLLIKKLSQISGIDIAKESGLHPYVVKKTMLAIKDFTEEELENYSFKLTELYHNARRGLADFSVGLEKILIN